MAAEADPAVEAWEEAEVVAVAEVGAVAEAETKINVLEQGKMVTARLLAAGISIRAFRGSCR